MQPLTDYIVFSGPAIRQARKEKGLKLADFAGDIGVCLGQASMIETGKRVPNADNLQRMKEVFGKPIVFI